MKEPLFPDLSPITENDRSRLSYHLRGWNHLVAILTLGTLEEEDLKKMIVLEAEGLARPTFLDKLAGRLLTEVRRDLKDRIRAYAKV